MYEYNAPHFIVSKLDGFIFVQLCWFPQTSESSRQLRIEFEHRLIIQITFLLQRLLFI